jgi:hypothetical protein
MRKLLLPFVFIVEAILLSVVTIAFSVAKVAEYLAGKMPNKEWYTND